MLLSSSDTCQPLRQIRGCSSASGHADTLWHTASATTVVWQPSWKEKYTHSVGHRGRCTNCNRVLLDNSNVIGRPHLRRSSEETAGGLAPDTHHQGSTCHPRSPLRPSTSLCSTTGTQTAGGMRQRC
ncbi:hypothetical protein CDAR_75041 [Caerostris darwini]|uniref:Uncharacterized protein n=1 Tax=Caerostris darwini TaxID=1538125 RepID=A0AAV4P020_9ARAC|nr:hypothetical protein CDAR_75041 [Caerostris darwini]